MYTSELLEYTFMPIHTHTSLIFMTPSLLCSFRQLDNSLTLQLPHPENLVPGSFPAQFAMLFIGQIIPVLLVLEF
jgi:hypothetical protein